MNVIKQRLGATHTVDFSEISVKDMPNVVKGMTKGKGVNVVYDPVGGEIWENSLKCTAWGARVAIVGWASNIQPFIKTNYILIKGLTILGCRAGESARKGFVNNKRRMAVLSQWVENGKLKPNVSHCFHINDIHKAFETVYMRKAIGKVVLEFGNLKNSKM